MSTAQRHYTDLQNAVDAMALTGARELDGRDDAITRAEAAIEKLANTAAFAGGGAGMSLGSSLTVSYDAGDDAASTVTVTFLKAIPDDDDDPIPGSMVTTDPNEAAYAWVAAKPQAMQTIFPIPVGFNRDDSRFGGCGCRLSRKCLRYHADLHLQSL